MMEDTNSDQEVLPLKSDVADYLYSQFPFDAILAENLHLEEIPNLDVPLDTTFKEDVEEEAEEGYEADVASPCQTGIYPRFEEFEGDFGFSISVPERDQKDFCYSQSLNKVYVVMDKTVPIDFSMDFEEAMRRNFCIRALMVFTKDEYITLPVQRCITHKDKHRNKPHGEHVLQAAVSHEAEYQQDAKSERFSVVVPVQMPQPGTNTLREMFKLTCKNSCIGGINRRETQIIFTLEERGKVVGRRSLPIRVCSCPKRDMDKEVEKTLTGKRKGQLPDEEVAVKPKKTKVPKKIKEPSSSGEDSDNEVYELNIKFRGFKRLQKALAALSGAEVEVKRVSR